MKVSSDFIYITTKIKIVNLQNFFSPPVTHILHHQLSPLSAS